MENMKKSERNAWIEYGHYCKCGMCERNVAYLWGILASIPIKNDFKKSQKPL